MKEEASLPKSKLNTDITGSSNTDITGSSNIFKLYTGTIYYPYFLSPLFFTVTFYCIIRRMHHRRFP